MSSVRILAPAKVNLGLAILEKREDGYHEIDTIMAMIDLCDEITITPTGDDGISISGMDDVPTESNLMAKAARLWSEAAIVKLGWRIEITKRIPSPAGLGGGSSDAAAVLLGLNDLHGRPLPPEDLHVIAASIGADCPFFLNGPCARATGIGTHLRPIPPPSGWIVLMVPRINAVAKTAKLYKALTQNDYRQRSDIDVVERSIGEQTLANVHLFNSFQRPALAEFAGLDALHQGMTDITGNASLSGAGPALFAVAASRAEAINRAKQLNEIAPSGVEVHIAPLLHSRPQAEILR